MKILLMLITSIVLVAIGCINFTDTTLSLTLVSMGVGLALLTERVVDRYEV